MTRTAGAPIGCQRPSRFWGLGCPKIYHEAEDTLELVEPEVHLGRHGRLDLLSVPGKAMMQCNTQITCVHPPAAVCAAVVADRAVQPPDQLFGIDTGPVLPPVGAFSREDGKLPVRTPRAVYAVLNNRLTRRRGSGGDIGHCPAGIDKIALAGSGALGHAAVQRRKVQRALHGHCLGLPVVGQQQGQTVQPSRHTMSTEEKQHQVLFIHITPLFPVSDRLLHIAESDRGRRKRLLQTVMVINLPAFLFGNQQGYTRQWLVGIVETVEQPVRDGSGGYRGRGKLPQPTVQIRQCSGITAVEMGVGANTDHDGMGGRLTAVDQGLIAKGQRVIHGPAHPGMGAVQAQPGTGRI
ncbi:hypothetical protein [Thiolapillus sp.]|uniref:hypothetical protein n=3 Tax=Thiolapillus sp. TaxID=2017437 RepID=UPI0025EEDA96|nr:hypothetical protein [Thiolapillus sp.]